MKLHYLIVQNLLIILFGVIVLYLDYIEFQGIDSRILLVCFSLIKSGYFLVTGFRKILIFSKSDLQYHHFLLFIGLSIMLVVFSYVADYLCLYMIEPSNFTGINAGLPWYELLFKFLFFSVMIFGNLGVVTVAPASSVAEFLMMTEAILSFITIIIVLSDFISLKESLMGKRTKS